MDDRENLELILESYGLFKPLRTIIPFSIHLTALVVLEIAAIVLTVYHPSQQYHCKEYFIIIYAHVALWFLALVRSYSYF